MTAGSPFVIGLIGGIASGKSRVRQVLESLGAAGIDADALGHTILARPLVQRRLKQVFGEQIVDEGRVDRARLASLIFTNDIAGRTARRQLEELVHPLIHAETVQRLRALREQPNAPAAVVIDAPLLLEAGWAPMCDAILFVDTTDEVRQQRALQRGWTLEQLADREEAQMPLPQKRRAATHHVSGELSSQELESFCSELLKSVQQNSINIS